MLVFFGKLAKKKNEVTTFCTTTTTAARSQTGQLFGLGRSLEQSVSQLVVFVFVGLKTKRTPTHSQPTTTTSYTILPTRTTDYYYLQSTE